MCRRYAGDPLSARADDPRQACMEGPVATATAADLAVASGHSPSWLGGLVSRPLVSNCRLDGFAEAGLQEAADATGDFSSGWQEVQATKFRQVLLQLQEIAPALSAEGPPTPPASTAECPGSPPTGIAARHPRTPDAPSAKLASRIRTLTSAAGSARRSIHTAAATAAASAAAAAEETSTVLAGQEPHPRDCFSAADLIRYQQLQQTVNYLASLKVPLKVMQAKQHAGRLHTQLVATERAWRNSQRAEAEARDEVDLCIERCQRPQSYTARLLKRNSGHQERLARSQAALHAAILQRQQQEHQAKVLHDELKEAQRTVAVWKSMEGELPAALRMLVKLVDRMFASPGWRMLSPRHCALVDAVRELEGQVAEAEWGLSSFSRGAELLAAAMAGLQEAAQELGNIQVLAMNQCVGCGLRVKTRRSTHGSSTTGDEPELQATIRHANNLVACAAGEAAQARAMLYGMPDLDNELLKEARMGLLNSVLHGRACADAVQMAAERAADCVRQMMNELAPASEWAHSRLSLYQMWKAELPAALAEKKAELEAFRKQALQAATASLT